MADATIRPLRPGDAPAWRALWTAYLAFYGTEVAEDVYDTTFARLQGTGDIGGRLAVTDRPVGLVHWIAHRHCWRTEDVTYLQDLYVAPEARGTGVAEALIQACCDEADRAGRPTVYWLTQTGNARARALYDRVATPTDFMKYSRRCA